MERKQKIVAIIGPTAVGKTKLGIEIAKHFNGEVISGDSMQIYRGMDIGTAKVTPGEMEGIPHHLIDIRNPDEVFSVAEFQSLVEEKITDISLRGKLPIIVGGTGLYIQSVLYDYEFTESPADPAFRERLEKLAREEGNEAVHRELALLDPRAAEHLHPNNVRRVIRALEIIKSSGMPLEENRKHNQPGQKYDAAVIGLTMDREKLYDRINQRVDKMVSEGLIEEVQSLYNQGLRDCQSIKAIGYKEIYDYLDGKTTLEESIEILKQNTRRYAKRQLTWFRNKMDVEWVNMTAETDFSKKVSEIFKVIEGKLQLKSNT
ncbi:tRNA (adenosine(37)-N6)-dimethylallyltransferase MiaA [Neobacillus notoginsengisoli]|uniref:tRNA dimethylallyltransferase n=1 Tax=Neobacillus notoginsengisoli TaxID=1578198 RepID=A0A417YQN1_9BACI|nr:tRNA (adenosine(37)-N6)-dimethylallyltransferase MiaA [Neobacillus notoginsengisoli]RHW36556.1 tRNA (adenosine(37)-N6)-dimethylallyltransferase MiaA [Neobacillus notoginsengisoli]